MSWWDDMLSVFGGGNSNAVDGDPLMYSVNPDDLDFDAFTSDLPGVNLAALLDLGSGSGLKLPSNATSLADVFNSGEPGLKLNDSPGIDSMGGGQGLTLDTDDLSGFWAGLPSGVLSATGLYPDSYTPVLGNANSFINDSSRPVTGAGKTISPTSSVTTGTGSALSGAAAGNPSTSSGNTLKDILNGNGGLNKLGLAALAAYLMNKDGKNSGSSGGWTPPANMSYNREQKAQDPNRRAGAANPGGYFGNVTYRAEGGLLKGPGDGLSDSIPAQIDGAAPAQLGTGEFVIPADVTSALGGGDSEAGARRLEEMLRRVRIEAHGHDQQIRPVSDKALPR